MNITQFSSQNSRLYQEDRSFFKKLKKEQLLLGIFDGHGSHWVADYAANHTPFLFQSIHKEIKKYPESVLKLLYSNLVEKTNDYFSGSTATIVWIKDNMAHVGILGDSLVIIKTADGDIWKSPEHNVRTNESEAIAAIKRGGKISPNGYLFDKWRIDGPGLQMTRALGDKELHDVLNREPEIFHIPINENSWLVACTDGLIDPAHTTDNIPVIIEHINNGATAEELVLEMANIQRDDNSTAILVRFE